MKIFYEKKDLISFANSIIDELKRVYPELKEYDGVSHADFENWIELKKKENGIH